MKSKEHLLLRCLERIDDLSFNIKIYIWIISLFLEVLIDIRDIMLTRDGREIPKD